MTLFLVLIGFLLISEPTFSQTKITGTIVKDTKWTVDQSPYVLLGDVVVEKGITLTIGRDTVLVFSRGSRFQVKGRLDAYRVFFNGFLQADNLETLLYLPGSSGSLTSCAFLDLNIVLDTSDIRLTYSVVSNHNGTGVTIGKKTSPHIADTSFHGNSYFAVYYQGSSSVKVTNCFWGSKTGPSDAGDGDGDAVSSNIHYTPFQPKEKIKFLILAKVIVQTGKIASDKSIQLTYHLFNMNHCDHEAVLGASLHGPEKTIIHHPESDIYTTITPGFHTFNREFKIPFNAEKGAYDVHCGIMNKHISGYFAYVKCKDKVIVVPSRLTKVKETLPATASDG